MHKWDLYFFPREPRRVLPNSRGSVSHLLIFTLSSAHLLSHHTIFTPSRLTSTLPPSHFLICSSSHFLILTSSHFHTFSSSHLLPFTSVALHTFSSTPSHLLIFSVSLSLSRLLYLFSLGRGWCRRGVTNHEPLQTRWGSIVKAWGNCPFTCAGTTLSHETMFNCQKTCSFNCSGETLSHEMLDRQKQW